MQAELMEFLWRTLIAKENISNKKKSNNRPHFSTSYDVGCPGFKKLFIYHGIKFSQKSMITVKWGCFILLLVCLFDFHCKSKLNPLFNPKHLVWCKQQHGNVMQLPETSARFSSALLKPTVWSLNTYSIRESSSTWSIKSFLCPLLVKLINYRKQ